MVQPALIPLKMALVANKQKNINGTNGAKAHGPDYGLSSSWSHYYSPPNTSAQGRWEGELENLVVYGEVPKEIEGTFCRRKQLSDTILTPIGSNFSHLQSIHEKFH